MNSFHQLSVNLVLDCFSRTWEDTRSIETTTWLGLVTLQCITPSVSATLGSNPHFPNWKAAACHLCELPRVSR